MKITGTVLTEINFQDGKKKVNKKMCFYLDRKHQANPPTPTDPDVKIFKPDKEVAMFVTPHEPWTMNIVHLKNAKKAVRGLHCQGITVNKDHFYTADNEYTISRIFHNSSRMGFDVGLNAIRNEVMFSVPLPSVPLLIHGDSGKTGHSGYSDESDSSGDSDASGDSDESGNLDDSDSGELESIDCGDYEQVPYTILRYFDEVGFST